MGRNIISSPEVNLRSGNVRLCSNPQDNSLGVQKLTRKQQQIDVEMLWSSEVLESEQACDCFLYILSVSVSVYDKMVWLFSPRKVKALGLPFISYSYLQSMHTKSSLLFFLLSDFFYSKSSFIFPRLQETHVFVHLFFFLAYFERFRVKHQRQVLINWQQRQLDRL